MFSIGYCYETNYPISYLLLVLIINKAAQESLLILREKVCTTYHICPLMIAIFGNLWQFVKLDGSE